MKESSAKLVAECMKHEIKRSMANLKSKGHPRPYYVSYLLREDSSYSVWGRYGALFSERKDKKRQCFADVRVGSYSYDHTLKGGLTDNSDEAESYELIEMPVEDSKDALMFSLWRLTDARYREAVKSYHTRKARDVSYLDSNKKLPSFLAAKPAKSYLKTKTFQVDEAKYRRLIKNASQVFKKYPEIKNSYVEFHASLETKVFVSSEGIERLFQSANYQLVVYMWFLNKKCNEDFTLNYHVADQKELPTLSQVKKDIEKKIETLYDLQKGDQLTSYAGPVLLCAKPAGLFIHEVVGHRLEGSRLLSDDEGRTFKDKIGQKVMHEGITIYDNPTLTKFEGRSLVGAYPFDDEGTKSKKTLLIEKGVLRSFLTTRSPIKARNHQSNGHARNQSYERPISRMGNMIIQTENGLSFADLKKALIEKIKEQNLDFGVILYEVEGGETGTEAYDFQAFLGEITRAVKVFADGREKPIKGVDFVGTPLSSLKNIIAVGKDLELDNAYCGAESGTVPVSTISPPLLLSNLELQAKDPAKVTQYKLPLPWVEG